MNANGRINITIKINHMNEYLCLHDQVLKPVKMSVIHTKCSVIKITQLKSTRQA